LKQGSPNLREVFGTDRASRREGRLEVKTAGEKEKIKKIPLFWKRIATFAARIFGFNQEKDNIEQRKSSI